MSRVQLALNVSDLEASVQFYSSMFSTQPHKRRPGYANFQINEPPLKLVLIETSEQDRGNGVGGALNHLGVEVESAQQVHDSIAHLRDAGLATSEEMGTTCCYAQQDKVWVSDPAGTPWEVYAITDDNPDSVKELQLADSMNDGGCCTDLSERHETTVGGQKASACC